MFTFFYISKFILSIESKKNLVYIKYVSPLLNICATTDTIRIQNVFNNVCAIYYKRVVL